jgi:FkbM family methyltransferase
MNLLGQLRWKALLGVFKVKRFLKDWFGTRMLDYSRAPLRIRTETIREYEVRARSVRKEPNTVAWLEAHAKKGAIIYDIGANVGAYSLIAAACGAEVFAFEPSHQNAYHLHENILLNSLDDRITVIPLVLGDKNGMVRFKVVDSTFGASRSFSSEGDTAGKAYPLLTLDAVRELLLLPAPTAIKIDVDGAEVELLKGAYATLHESSLQSLLVEADDGNEEKVKRTLLEAGFSVAEEARMDRHTVNYVFERV